jgi:phospholipid/cholesterol/gamma-HCH transport system permease protein
MRLLTPPASLLQAVALLGEVILALGQGLVHGWVFRRADFLRVLLAAGGQALLIVLVVNVLVGAIIAFVGAVQLLKFGAGVFVADLVAIAVSREMAAVITAVVMAGRTGAAFAAELASMKTNEEIDALEVLGLQPVAFLVVPRVLAMLLMLPLLYGFACVAGLAGGYAVSATLLDLPPVVYINRSIEALSFAHLGLGFSKCFAFGLLVALAGCHHGLRAERHAAGVGQATTRAVVAGIVGVIAIDAVFAVCANALGV